jgi:hypothetical protein
MFQSGQATAAAVDTPESPPVKTPLSAPAVMGALQTAWTQLVGSAPTKNALAMMAAQSAVETAAWAVCYDYNLGNITHITGDGFSWNHRPEVTDPNMRYRSYPNLLSGATDFVRWILKHGNAQAAMSGDVQSYGQALINGCYLGCNPDPTTASNYINGISTWYHKLLPINVAPVAVPVGPNWVLVAAVGGVVAWLLYRKHAEGEHGHGHEHDAVAEHVTSAEPEAA